MAIVSLVSNLSPDGGTVTLIIQDEDRGEDEVREISLTREEAKDMFNVLLLLVDEMGISRKDIISYLVGEKYN